MQSCTFVSQFHLSSHLHLLPPSLNVTCLFKEHPIFLPLSFCHWQLCFLYLFLYSSINFSLYLCVCFLMQAITSFLNLICLPMPLKFFFSTTDLAISTSLNLWFYAVLNSQKRINASSDTDRRSCLGHIPADQGSMRSTTVREFKDSFQALNFYFRNSVIHFVSPLLN